MHTEAFEELYKTLNPNQRKAVDAIEGPVMVIAGPGTGKTQILTLRIANILLKTDTAPEQILALTFTESGVTAMRKRLATIIGSRAYQVRISTFHSFCDDVIKRYPEYFPIIIGSRPITDVEQVAVMESVITKTPLELLRPWGDPTLYIRPAVSAIAELKREGIVPEVFASLVHTAKARLESTPDLYYESGAHQGKMRGKYADALKKINKNEELSRLYSAYEEALRDRQQYDFNDMIVEVLLALQNHPELLLILQETYQYFLIDEHQDTNNAQNKIIELLASFHESPNLFVVGDEKQAIFRFQGASLENFYYFKDRFAGALLIPLKENYRSTQPILDAAESLLAGTASLESQQQTGKPISLYLFPNIENEHFFIATHIKEKIDSGTLPNDIAILYRSNREAFSIASMLERMNIPYVIESDTDLFADSDVQTLILLLQAIAEFGRDEVLTQLLHLPLLGIHPLDAYRLIRLSSQKRLYGLFDIVLREEFREEAKLIAPERVVYLATLLLRLKELVGKVSVITFTEEVFRESGLLQHILTSPQAITRMETIAGFFDEVRRFSEQTANATLAGFFQYLATLKMHNLTVKKTSTIIPAGKVRLMTAHRSKGLEFKVVYLAHAVAGIWGDRKDRELLPLLPDIYQLREISLTADDQADERRLFYVALTRAKEEFILTAHTQDANGRERILSPFIQEIDPALVEIIATESYVSDFKQTFPLLLEKPIEHVRQADADDRGYIKELFESQGFSVSALNNYLECPWKYFYRNLIRVPSTTTIHQYYGQAIHAALDAFFKRRVYEETDATYLTQIYQKAVQNFPLSASDTETLLARGSRVLVAWYQAYKDDPAWNNAMKTEFRVAPVLCNGIKLTGVFDRIDFLGGNEVFIIDYKTGKPKSRNELEGKTKEASTNYYRQLIFYKILLECFDEGKYVMREGEIHFVEPDEKGKFHREVFSISDDAVTELRTVIDRTAEEIRSLSFWNSRCGDKECEFCALRNLMNRGK